MTQETKWTRGPWQKNYGRRHSPDECDIEIVGDIFVLANINGPNYAHCEANADLIAAAPEMAEALRAARVQIDFWKKTAANATGNLMPHIVPAESVIEQIDAALQKAGG